MHYYKFNIKDWRLSTSHLTPAEDIIYLRLIGLYYLNESPLVNDIDSLAKLTRLIGYEEDIKQILSEFFVLKDGLWHQLRCDIEIAKYYEAKKSHWGNKLTKSQRACIQAERNATKANATPEWLTIEQRKSIAQIYKKSADLTLETGIKHEVDHIIPLRGKSVCGLHVPWNLQVIEGYKNRLKSNTLENVNV